MNLTVIRIALRDLKNHKRECPALQLEPQLTDELS